MNKRLVCFVIAMFSALSLALGALVWPWQAGLAMMQGPAAAAFTISGTVTGPGGPVAGATMFYLSPCNHEFGNTVETDASGHYTFTLEGPAEVCIVAVPPLPTKLAQAPHRITVTEDTSGVDIAVESGRLLSGRVVDQNGRPAPVPRPGHIPWKLTPGLYDYWLEGIFPGTPFNVGDALSPSVVVQPAVPATVSVEFSLYPDSDPAQAIAYTLSGKANRFGYFYPLVNWETGKLVSR